MPLAGTIPDTPDHAVLVFDVKDGDPVSVARGLAAAQAVFRKYDLAPNKALMAHQEVSALSLDVSEANNMEIERTGKELSLDPEWEQLCLDAEVWNEAGLAALWAYCSGKPEQKVHYRFHMDWVGHELSIEEEAWWPFLHVVGPQFFG